jgi:hypothetical protein
MRSARSTSHERRNAADTSARANGVALRRTARDTDAVIRGLARLVLLRFLPRRLLPVLTAWEIVQLLRSRRRGQTTRVAQDDASLAAARRRQPSTRRPRPR